MKSQSVISEDVRAIRAKIEAGSRLTTKEKKLEVSRDEAAYLLSAIAGRDIAPGYIKQLTRGEKPRLVPGRPIGNTYLYRVESLLGVRFTKAHKPPRHQPLARSALPE